jgi:signal transduction histidine kinase/CheY-like chemotaxis protein/HPt (histidine-containing phosphotransfer) domain-containing protein
MKTPLRSNDEKIISLKARFSLFFAVFLTSIFSVIAFSSYKQYDDIASIVATRLGLPIVKRASAFIDGDAFERLSQTLNSNDPFYEETRIKLKELKEETQCLYLYTMAPYTEKIHRFIIDGGEPGEEGFSPLGTEENIESYTHAYLKAFNTKKNETGGVNFSAELVDKWGRLSSTYSPIFNSSGDVVGVIGCDFEADDIYKMVYNRILQQIIFASFFLIIGFLMYFALLASLTKQNQHLLDLSQKMKLASESKSRFLAQMSHEIRTPMNAVLGMSELAIMELSEYGNPKASEYVTNIRQAGVNLLAIINDLLDFSKIESGNFQINLAPYELSSLLSGVLTIIQTRIEEKPIQLITEIDHTLPAVLKGDEARVRQVLLNLLSNAVKYTREGYVKFTVSCELKGNDEAMLTFAIQDSGIGIRTEDMGKLFVDFARVDPQHNKNIEGTGLGLAIARNLCRAMGGDIAVESEHGRGSTFTATLMQIITDARHIGSFDEKNALRPAPSSVRFTAPDFHVLIVDDIATNIAVIEGLIAPYKMNVSTCQSGGEAIRLIGETSFDLIFMDHLMPEMDGIEATTAIRGFGGGYFRNIPIIALTANAMTGMKEMYLENGFNDYLSKPIEINKLNELMERWVPAEKRAKAEGRETYAAAAHETNLVINGINTAYGLAATGGTEGGYLKVLETFCKDAAARLEILREAPDEKNIASFATQVHALKSASASIGAAGLSEEAARLEVAGKRGDIAAISEGLPNFREHLSATVERIRAALPPENSGDRRGGSPLLDKGALFPLKYALETEDIREIDRIMKELDASQFGDETGNIVRAIADKVLTSEFKEAARIIGDFMNSGADADEN